MRFSSLVLACFVVPLAAACTSVEVAPAEIVNACKHLFAQRVAYDQRCIGAPPAASEEQAYVSSCTGIATAPGSRLTAGDIEACAADLGSDCTSGNAHPSCVGEGANLLYPNHDRKGSAEPGDPCIAHLQCASGWCSASGDACGTCQRALSLGEACTKGTDVCVGAWCIDGICQLPGKKEGEACIDYGGGDCQETLYCKVLDGIDGICTSRGQPGAACDSDTQCAEGSFCDGNACARLRADGESCEGSPVCASTACIEGVCGPITAGAAEGEPCSSSAYCRWDLTCGPDSVCTTREHAPLGAACDAWWLPGKCAPGLYCDFPCIDSGCSGVCRELPEPGQPCGTVAACAEGAVCVGSEPSASIAGTCVKLGRTGEACPCGDMLACLNDVCATFGENVCE